MRLHVIDLHKGEHVTSTTRCRRISDGISPACFFFQLK